MSTNVHTISLARSPARWGGRKRLHGFIHERTAAASRTCGDVLLLSNRYVTLALTLLGAVLALWLVLAYSNRDNLAPIFKK